MQKKKDNPLTQQPKNPGLKYLTLLEYIGYKNHSFRDLLTNDGTKLLSDYLKPSEFEKFFDNKNKHLKVFVWYNLHSIAEMAESEI